MAVSFEDYEKLKRESPLLSKMARLLRAQHLGRQTENFWEKFTGRVLKSAVFQGGGNTDRQQATRTSRKGDEAMNPLHPMEMKLQQGSDKLQQLALDATLREMRELLFGENEDVVKAGDQDGDHDDDCLLNAYDECVTAHLLAFCYEILPQIVLERYGRHLRGSVNTSNSSMNQQSKKFPPRVFSELTRKYQNTALREVGQACLERTLPRSVALARHCQALAECHVDEGKEATSRGSTSPAVASPSLSPEQDEDLEKQEIHQKDAYAFGFEKRILNALAVSCENVLLRLAYACLDSYPELTDDLFHALMDQEPPASTAVLDCENAN